MELLQPAVDWRAGKPQPVPGAELLDRLRPLGIKMLQRVNLVAADHCVLPLHVLAEGDFVGGEGGLPGLEPGVGGNEQVVHNGLVVGDFEEIPRRHPLLAPLLGGAVDHQSPFPCELGNLVQPVVFEGGGANNQAVGNLAPVAPEYRYGQRLGGLAQARLVPNEESVLGHRGAFHAPFLVVEEGVLPVQGDAGDGKIDGGILFGKPAHPLEPALVLLHRRDFIQERPVDQQVALAAEIAPYLLPEARIHGKAPPLGGLVPYAANALGALLLIKRHFQDERGIAGAVVEEYLLVGHLNRRITGLKKSGRASLPAALIMEHRAISRGITWPRRRPPPAATPARISSPHRDTPRYA